MHGEGKRHNQLGSSWTKTLNLVSRIVNEKFASSNLAELSLLNYNENVAKQKYEYSMKIQTNKVKILTLKYTSLPCKSQRLKVGGLDSSEQSSHCRNLNKGTCPKLDGNFAAEMKLPTSSRTSAWTISMNHPFLFYKRLANQSSL